MTPTKDVPEWPELVDCVAKSLGNSAYHEVPGMYTPQADRILRAAGLTPEILEDARAVAWVEENPRHLWFGESVDGVYRWKGTGLPISDTLREAVAAAKEADRG